jgi:hypothetical protein
MEKEQIKRMRKKDIKEREMIRRDPGISNVVVEMGAWRPIGKRRLGRVRVFLAKAKRTGETA